MGCRLSHFSAKFLCPTWTRLHGLNLLCPAFLTLSDRLYTFDSKPNCGAHSWGVPHCHCPLEIRRPVALSLGDVATPATILLWPSSFLQQRTSTCESSGSTDRAGTQDTRQRNTHTHTHTRCKAQPISQRWCSTTQSSRWYIVNIIPDQRLI